MTISQLIEGLDKFRTKYGDIEVRMNDYDFGANEISSIVYEENAYTCSTGSGSMDYPIALLRNRDGRDW